MMNLAQDHQGATLPRRTPADGPARGRQEDGRRGVRDRVPGVPHGRRPHQPHSGANGDTTETLRGVPRR